MNLINQKYLSEINKKNTQNGMGLVAAVFFVTIFSMFAIIIATFLLVNQKMNVLTAVNTKVFYLAESGLEYGIKKAMDTGSWDWTDTQVYGNGNINVTVNTVGNDSISIVSESQLGPYGSKTSMLLSVLDFSQYSVYISGDNKKDLGYDDISHLRFNVLNLPDMNLDSMRSIAQAQGHYYTGNLTISDAFPLTEFWSNPADHSQNATIYFTEGDLTISKSNTPIGGIFVTKGNVQLKEIGNIYGIIYIVNNTKTQSVKTVGKNAERIIYGGIIGNTNIDGKSNKNGPQITVYYDYDILIKFYTYSTNSSSSIINKLLWTRIY